MSDTRADNVLLRRVSRAMLWNAAMLPAVTIVNLAAAVMIRRGFGLQSGIYDVAIGVLNTLLAHSEIGLPASVNQFVPGLERNAGRAEIRAFLGRVASLRFALLIAALVPFNLFAPWIADRFHLGMDGVWLVRIISAMALFRSASDLAIETLQALLSHLLANVVQLCQAVTLVAAVAWAVWTGAPVSTVLGGLALAAIGVAITSSSLAWWRVRQVPDHPQRRAGEGSVPWSRLWRFALFMYVFEASNYFTTPAFASPALAAASGGAAIVALFNVAFQFPMMVVVVILAGFQGLYRPLFAGVLAEQNPERVRMTFSEVSKVQALLLIPAGVGLLLMLPDYVTLLFTRQFASAVPLARILCVFMFLEALFNLGGILLSVDHRYTPSLIIQGLRIVGTPAFVLLALRGQMLLATTAFGAGRLLAAGLGFVIARRLYGVRFPAAFTFRVCCSTMAMAIVIGLGQSVLPSTWLVAGLLTAVGGVLGILGIRWFRVLGPRELDLLKRARLPGKDLVLRLALAPSEGSRS